MNASVRALVRRLARDEAFADAYFADPDATLATLELDEADRVALRALDREAVRYLDAAPALEPAVAPEHPAAGRGWAGLLIGVWACVAFVVLWLLVGPGA